jgi:three-Cys-motif partner protein
LTDDFFDESTEQSRIKAAIVKDYFGAWSKIVLKKQAGPIAHADLFSGPGKYRDGTKSTPLLILERAISDPELRKRLVTIFNDADEENIRSLRTEAAQLSGIEKLIHQPDMRVGEVGNETVETFRKIDPIPTLLFIDPWGYKGLSLDLIKAFLKNWGCECIFFFNYNRINPALANEVVKEHMNALFGSTRAQSLRERLEGLPPKERELAIIDALCDALAEVGAKFVLPFCFKDDRSARTSHYLVFASKHPVGYGIMKDIMAKASSERHQGVASLGYCPASAIHPTLFELSRPLDDLEEMLLKEFAGQTRTTQQIYDLHNVGRPYTMKNYKAILLKMQEQDLIRTDPPAAKRRKGTFGDNVRVTFPGKDAVSKEGK